MEDQVHAQEIISRYQNGERHFENLEIEGDFSNCTLQGITFENCFIVADFRYCDLTNAKFLYSNIKTCDFRYAKLTDSVFEELAVESTQFYESITEGILFRNNFSYGQLIKEADFERLFKTPL